MMWPIPSSPEEWMMVRITLEATYFFGFWFWYLINRDWEGWTPFWAVCRGISCLMWPLWAPIVIRGDDIYGGAL